MIFMGCDPGQTGGVALVTYGQLLYVGRFVRERPSAIAAHLATKFDMNDISPWIEKVHGWKGQPAKSTFSFGFEAGRAWGMYEQLGLTPQEVDPKAWQKTIGWVGTWGTRNAKQKRDHKKARKDWIWAKVQETYGVKCHKDVADAIGIALAASLNWGF